MARKPWPWLARLDMNVASLTEARLVDSGKDTVEGHTFLHSGGTQRLCGVCLILSSKVKHSLKSWEPISNRLLTARLSHRLAISPSLSLMLQPTAPQTPIKMASMISLRMLSATYRHMTSSWSLETSMRSQARTGLVSSKLLDPLVAAPQMITPPGSSHCVLFSMTWISNNG